MNENPYRISQVCAVLAANLVLGCWVHASEESIPAKVGTQAPIGCGPDARRVKRLVISEPGVYENYLVDGDWGDSTLVKINADGVTLRRCEIRHGRHNAVT